LAEKLASEKRSSLSPPVTKKTSFSPPTQVELSPEEIAEVLSTLVDINDERKMEILISNKTVKALINGNVFDFVSTETFPKDEKFNLDLTGMPMEPSDVFLNKEVKDLIHLQFINNLRHLVPTL
jgi:hypothetical protein